MCLAAAFTASRCTSAVLTDLLEGMAQVLHVKECLSSWLKQFPSDLHAVKVAHHRASATRKALR